MTEKKTEETEDPVLSRIGKFGRFQARVSPTYRVVFLTGPTQKSSKYGTGPPQQEKITRYTGPS